MNNSIDMLNGSIFKGLVRFSLPLALSGVLQILFNAADIVVIGRFGSNNSLAAVGAVGILWGLFGHMFMSLGGGATVVAGKFIGAGKKSAVSSVLHVSTALALVLGAALSIFAWIFMPQILSAMQIPEEVFGLSLKYVHCLIPCIPGIAVYNFCAGILRAKGDTKRPLYFLLSAGIVNVLLNLIFVIALKMDVAGVGLATSASQYLASALIVICLLREEGEFRLEIKKIRLDFATAAAILRIGVPNVIQNLLFTISNLVIQTAINSFGAVVMAGNAAASNLENFTWTAMISVEQAALAFVSQNLAGAGLDLRDRRLFGRPYGFVRAAAPCALRFKRAGDFRGRHALEDFVRALHFVRNNVVSGRRHARLGPLDRAFNRGPFGSLRTPPGLDFHGLSNAALPHDALAFNHLPSLVAHNGNRFGLLLCQSL